MSNPIAWVDRNSKFHRPAYRWNDDGERVPVLDDKGRPVMERIPQTGKVGVVREVEDIKATKPMSAPRSILFLRDDGNEVHCIIRSAAAAGFGDKGSDHSFRAYALAKGRHFGWIPAGSCPVDLVQRRERNALQLVSLPLREAAKRGEGCQPHQVGLDKPPCKHYLAERSARQADRLAEHKRQEQRQKSDASRTTDALVEFVQKMAPNAAPAPADPAQEFAPQKKGPAK